MKSKFIELDETRELRYDYNSIADMEEKVGRGIGSLLNQEHIGLSTIRALLWAGMRFNERNLTFQTVGNRLHNFINNGGNIGELVPVVLEALQEAKIIGKIEGNVETEAAKE